MVESRAAVVVVGGGVIGTSVAFHLAEAGVEGVVVLERAELGSGSTVRAAGGIRAQFLDELNIAIALRSIEAYQHFRERPGWEIGLRQDGYLFLLTTPQDVATFQRNVALQNAYGVPTAMLTPAQAAERSGLILVDDVLAATFCPLGGHASPEAVVLGYASVARELGARIHTGVQVTGIQVEGERICGVVTDMGVVETAVVICAADRTPVSGPPTVRVLVGFLVCSGGRTRRVFGS